jgi:thiamine biosynthesis lipoprotein
MWSNPRLRSNEQRLLHRRRVLAVSAVSIGTAQAAVEAAEAASDLSVGAAARAEALAAPADGAEFEISSVSAAKVNVDTTGDIARAVFPSMGNTARITIIGGSQTLVDHAARRLRQLEERWSRFISTSDISRLNAARGLPVTVHPDTVRLVRHMVGGWTFTNGLFDPSMLGELVEAGYARSMTSNSITVLETGIEWSKDLSSVAIDADDVFVPHGMVLDPGGIGKGLAADIVAGELVDLGASGALVSIGGDIRCIGRGDIEGQWIIDVESPFDRQPMCSIGIAEGAIATSSLTAKLFTSPDGSGDTRSHIMDSRSRRTVDPTSHDIVQASVIAAECVWAEVFAKAHLVVDTAARIELAAEHGLEAMFVHRDGSSFSTRGWKAYQI